MIEADHYCIDPLSRVDWEDIQKLIRDKRYFVMYATTASIRAAGRASPVGAHLTSKQNHCGWEIFRRTKRRHCGCSTRRKQGRRSTTPYSGSFEKTHTASLGS
ncbi:MAG: hypothetical protein FWH01_17820 [Oscillospiraceae bacterium]|nr:hypothetical protein [Oscillospiraceae bacterium]